MKFIEDTINPKIVYTHQLFDNPTLDWNSTGDELITVAKANPEKVYVICDDDSISNLPSFLRLLNRDDSPNIKAEQHLYNSMSEENFSSLYDKLDLDEFYKALEDNTNPESNKYATGHLVQFSRAINKASDGRFSEVEYFAGEKLFILHGHHPYEAMACLHTNGVIDRKYGFVVGGGNESRFCVELATYPIDFHAATERFEFVCAGETGDNIHYSATASYEDDQVANVISSRNDLLFAEAFDIDIHEDSIASWIKVVKANAIKSNVALDINFKANCVNKFIADFVKDKERKYAHYKFRDADMVYGYPWPNV